MASSNVLLNGAGRRFGQLINSRRTKLAIGAKHLSFEHKVWWSPGKALTIDENKIPTPVSERLTKRQKN
jgi:hypothetical protein